MLIVRYGDEDDKCFSGRVNTIDLFDTSAQLITLHNNSTLALLQIASLRTHGL